VRRQSEAATVLWIGRDSLRLCEELINVKGPSRKKIQAPLPLRSAGVLQIGGVV